MPKNDQIPNQEVDKDLTIDSFINWDDEEEQEDQEDEEQEEEQENQEEDEDQEEWQDDDEEEQEDEDEQKVVTMDEYKQLQRSASKWVEKVLNRNAVLTQTLKLLPQVAEEPKKLISIYEENPEVAQVILENYYDGITIEEYAETWLGSEYTPKEAEKKPLSEDDIRQEERQKIAQEQVEEHVAKLFNKAKLNKQEAEKVLEEYEDLTEWKVLTQEKATKYFQIAYSLVRKTPVEDAVTKTVKATAPGAHWGAGSKTKSEDPYLTDAKKFLKDNWIVS